MHRYFLLFSLCDGCHSASSAVTAAEGTEKMAAGLMCSLVKDGMGCPLTLKFYRRVLMPQLMPSEINICGGATLGGEWRLSGLPLTRQVVGTTPPLPQ